MNTKDIVSLYKRLSAVATPKSAVLTTNDDSSSIKVQTFFSSQDPCQDSDISYSRNFHYLPNSDEIITSDSVLTRNNVLWDVASISGSQRAIFVKDKSKEKDDVYRVQIWTDGVFEKSIDLSAKNKHGSVYGPSGSLGNCCWSYAEGHLLYVAEKKQPKKESYFSNSFVVDLEKSEDEKDRSAADGKVFGQQFDVLENWGEQLTDKCSSVICSLDVHSEVISVLDNIPAGVFPGAPCWVPDDSGVLFVGYSSEPIKLGLIYCQQRQCCIYFLDFASGVCEVVGHDQRSVTSPRFSPCGTKVVWLENTAGGAHRQCQRLIQCDWPSREIRTVIEVVQQAGDTGFPGLYATDMPVRCWSSDSSAVLLHSITRSRVKLIVVHIDRKLGEFVQVPDIVGDAEVLDYHNDWLVAQFSSPTTPPYLVLTRLSPSKPNFDLKWVRLTQPDVVEGMAWQVIKHTPTLSHPDFGNQTFESIFVYPDVIEPTKRKEGLPLIAMPHGGPHGTFTASFQKYVTGFVQCGFACLLINYRGSLGFGENFITSLLGRVGEQDVSDCIDAINDMLQCAEFSFAANQVSVIGGSHGGFLAGHLVGQHPGIFKAAVLRNPVINLVSMITSSDIPDWVYVEGGYDFTPGRIPDESVLSNLFRRSPLHYVDQVTTPCLIMLGAKDARVPPSQGKEFHQALKARKCITRLLSYPEDSHPIVSSAAASDAFVNIVQWLAEHTSFSSENCVVKCFHSHST